MVDRTYEIHDDDFIIGQIVLLTMMMGDRYDDVGNRGYNRQSMGRAIPLPS